MDATKIYTAANEIERLQKALGWLKDYGAQLDSDNDFSFQFTCHFASMQPGYQEAEMKIGNWARFKIKSIVQSAINDCENTIEILRGQIAEQVQP